jgi:hypothetical protein
VKLIRLMKQWQWGWTRSPVIEMLHPPVFAVCDDDDYGYLIQWLWYSIRDYNKSPDFERPRAVVKLDGNRLSARRSLTDYRILTMERVVWFHHTGDWSPRVYHINRDSRDNRYENLTRNLKQIAPRSA